MQRCHQAVETQKSAPDSLGLPGRGQEEDKEQCPFHFTCCFGDWGQWSCPESLGARRCTPGCQALPHPSTVLTSPRPWDGSRLSAEEPQLHLSKYCHSEESGFLPSFFGCCLLFPSLKSPHFYWFIPRKFTHRAWPLPSVQVFSDG